MSKRTSGVFDMRGPLSRLGVVAIGRNEGARLQRCLTSIPSEVALIVYVDSGSTDDSVQFARSVGAEVVELDTSIPFTAARARNAGLSRLNRLRPDLSFVQFVDGDCSIASGWFTVALAALDDLPNVVAVFGRRRERHPDASAYNRLCDLEWGLALPGQTRDFGGDVLVRRAEANRVGGYDATIIAGEDPDFAVRLRQAGGQLLRLDAEMTLHDADMHSLTQWWTRAKRGGYAYGQVSQKHAESPEQFWTAEKRRILRWGFWVPLSASLLALPTLGASTLLLSAYPARAFRLIHTLKGEGMRPEDARLWAAHCILASIPEAIGVLKHRWDQLVGRQAQLIEYKGPAD